MIPGWKEEIEQQYLAILRAHPRASSKDLATRLGVSEADAIYWLTALAREGRVRILGFDLPEEGDPRSD